jgi:WD40 repeat protein
MIFIAGCSKGKATSQLSFSTAEEEHISGISALSFSDDDKNILTVSDGVIRIWELQAGKQVQFFETGKSAVQKAIFNPDSSKIAFISKLLMLPNCFSRIFENASGY